MGTFTSTFTASNGTQSKTLVHAFNVRGGDLTTSPTSSVSDTTARISFRAAAASTVAVKYGTASDLSDAQTTAGVAVDATTDFTGKIDIDSLPADTQHYYTLLVNGVDQYSAPYPSFKTLPAAGAPAAFSFAFGSCTQHNGGTDAIFDAVPPDVAFLIHIGDTIYADDSPAATTLADYRAKQQAALTGADATSAAWKALRERTPVLTMWDDHDLINDYDAGNGTARYAAAKQAFQEYQARANPDGLTAGELYYTIQVGDVGFFFADLRSFRSANATTDDASKTILGATQKTALKNWLLASTGLKFKIIVASVPAHGYASNTGGDSWGGVDDGTQAPNGSNGFRAERNEIWDFVDANQIPGVMFLSGDQHWAGSFKTTYAGRARYEIMASPYNRSNLTPVARATDPINGPVLWKYGSGVNMGIVSVDTTVSPATIEFQLYDQSGSLGSAYLTSLTTNDIDAGLVPTPAITLSAAFPPSPKVGDTANFDITATLSGGATGTPTITVDQLPAGLTLGTTSQVDATHFKATVSGTYTTVQAGTSTYSVTGGSVAAAPLVHGYNVQAAATSGYWNPVQTSSAITISGATATRGAAADAWRSTVGAATASGLCYFEVAIGTLVNKDTAGVANASATVSNYIGADNNSVGLHSNGTVFRGGGNVGSGGTYASGDVVMIAVDEPNRKIWFGKNGTWVSGNPVTETGAILIAATGELYPAAALYSNGSSVTLRLSNSEFSYAPPSGYSSWSGT